MAINYNGDISVVLDMQHRTPGNLPAFVQATLRSIRTGKSSDVRFSSTERIEPVPMIAKKMEFSYKDGADYVNARRIINGTDRAALIAGYAVRMETMLLANFRSAK